MQARRAIESYAVETSDSGSCLIERVTMFNLSMRSSSICRGGIMPIMNYWLVDAFTQSAFRGNPASVIYLPDKWTNSTESLMKNIARETNSPVTAFIHQKDPSKYLIRWFTPSKELELCGHATLAASHVLYNETNSISFPEPITFETKFNGDIVVSGSEIDRSLTQLTFPASILEPVDISPSNFSLLADIFGIRREDLEFTARSSYDLVLVLQPERFQSLPRTEEINFQRLKEVETLRGIIITSLPAAADQGRDFLLRMFLPRYGIDEDHVSGSAFSAVGNYWRDRLRSGGVVRGYQQSARGGEVLLSWSQDQPDSIHLAGCCRTVVKGELVL